MKRKSGFLFVIALAVFTSALFYGEPRHFGDEPMFDGPGGPGMMQDGPMKGKRMHPDEGMEREGPGHFGGIFIPEVQVVLENYHIKAQKIFLDAKQAKVNLQAKRKDLVEKLTNLAESYPTNKAAGKDIINLTKELNGIQDQIMDINHEAMKKIEILNQDREKEIKAARDTWIKKISSDQKELDKYVDFINKKSFNPKPR